MVCDNNFQIVVFFFVSQPFDETPGEQNSVVVEKEIEIGSYVFAIEIDSFGAREILYYEVILFGELTNSIGYDVFTGMIVEIIADE